MLSGIICKILELEMGLESILPNCFIQEVKKGMIHITQIRRARPTNESTLLWLHSGLQIALGYATQ